MQQSLDEIKANIELELAEARKLLGSGIKANEYKVTLKYFNLLNLFLNHLNWSNKQMSTSATVQRSIEEHEAVVNDLRKELSESAAKADYYRKELDKKNQQIKKVVSDNAKLQSSLDSIVEECKHKQEEPVEPVLKVIPFDISLLSRRVVREPS
jgi:chromosome segregation ATPase